MTLFGPTYQYHKVTTMRPKEANNMYEYGWIQQ